MNNKTISRIRRFFQLEYASGVLLLGAAILAILLANTPLSRYYDLLIETPVVVAIADFKIAKPLLLWVNDGLMVIFFLMVGLELKREMIEGELSDISKISLPAIGAVGGMLVPALVYLAFTYTDSIASKGWAIPAATDIAFALGILSLLGSRVPVSVKVFLTSLAIFDDIGAIAIIALFYTANISVVGLLVSGICITILFLFNRWGVNDKKPYLIVGLIMWAALLKSGVHATLAGVIIAMFIPLKSSRPDEQSPLKVLEHELHFLVSFFILPVFAFANSGVRLLGLSLDYYLHDVTLGVAAGLFFGKQMGIFLFCWLAIKLGLSRLPNSMSYHSLYGIAALCGIGFTMSLFIGSLAFEETGVNLIFDERVGIIAGSLCSGVLGYWILKKSLPKSA